MPQTRVVFKDDGIASLLSKIVLSSQKKQQMLDRIGSAMVASTRGRFAREQSPLGAPWKKSNRALFDGGKTLQDSGRLYASIRHIVSGDSVDWGTDVFYGEVHHFGRIIRAKNAPFLRFRTPNGGFAQVKQVVIPARPWLGVSADDKARINQIINQVIVQ